MFGVIWESMGIDSTCRGIVDAYLDRHYEMLVRRTTDDVSSSQVTNVCRSNFSDSLIYLIEHILRDICTEVDTTHFGRESWM